jgi:protein-L-isoaspartate(D-aspartate) O-methyltransferase
MKHQSLKFKQRRQGLVDKLRKKGIKNERVLDAINHVPRHVFIDTALEDRAYKDSALPIGMGQTISQPYTVARQTELLEVFPGEKVLEIGTGSGYQAAIL